MNEQRRPTDKQWLYQVWRSVGIARARRSLHTYKKLRRPPYVTRLSQLSRLSPWRCHRSPLDGTHPSRAPAPAGRAQVRPEGRAQGPDQPTAIRRRSGTSLTLTTHRHVAACSRRSRPQRLQRYTRTRSIMDQPIPSMWASKLPQSSSACGGSGAAAFASSARFSPRTDPAAPRPGIGLPS
jgi:hypothetical protein